MKFLSRFGMRSSVKTAMNSFRPRGATIFFATRRAAKNLEKKTERKVQSAEGAGRIFSQIGTPFVSVMTARTDFETKTQKQQIRIEFSIQS